MGGLVNSLPEGAVRVTVQAVDHATPALHESEKALDALLALDARRRRLRFPKPNVGPHSRFWTPDSLLEPAYPYAVVRSVRTNLRRSRRKALRRRRLVRFLGWLPWAGARLRVSAAEAWLENRLGERAVDHVHASTLVESEREWRR